MTVSMDDLIAAEERGPNRCKVCAILSNLAPGEAAKWQAWASRLEPKTSSTASARVLSTFTDGDVLSHSIVDRHIASKHGLRP